MALSGTVDLAGLFNKVIDDAFFLAREGALMPQLVLNLQADTWADREMPRYAKPAAAKTVGEEEDIAIARAFAKTTVTITPAEVADQIILTDRKIQTDPDGAQRDASRDLADAIVRRVEEDLTGVFSLFDSQKGAGANTTFTFASVGKAAAIVRNNSTPGQAYGVFHPFHYYDMWVEFGQPAATQAFLGDVGNEALRNYFVEGRLGMLWFQDPYIKVDASDDAYSAVFVRDAIAFDVRKPPTLEPERDASARGWELNMTMGYAYGERAGTYGVGLLADATSP